MPCGTTRNDAVADALEGAEVGVGWVQPISRHARAIARIPGDTRGWVEAFPRGYGAAGKPAAPER